MLADSTLTLDSAISGVAAGVPYVAMPPASGADQAPMVVAWHSFEPPRSEVALAGTLPMAGVDAWRVYLGLPMFGTRLPEGGLAEIQQLGGDDYLLNLLGPVVEKATAELGAAVAELSARLPVSGGPVALAGVGEGGTAVLLALAESGLPVAAAGVVNPVVFPAHVLAAREREAGAAYRWTDRSRELAAWLDFTTRAADIGGRMPRTPLLVVTGQADEVVRPAHGQALHDALVRAYAEDGPAEQTAEQPTSDDRLRHITIPDLTHTMGPEPGLRPGPPAPGPVLADRALTEWFRRFLAEG
ncbi:alpha/beta hydrolase family protein [Allonocardiopsis opalescens]|uniref:Prolyl oligopeptidase family protein n=1 Tax=Allonocardiopsis opalescens TaxID=1144618 RepID=A0A2T0Q6M7_9ACTN|nr:alpha/beta hydrolase [Allonocardiopsis opalescens]PRX99454.1 hypothetical protein CLV72_10350 [Allonocardiopsis opalescens]